MFSFKSFFTKFRHIFATFVLILGFLSSSITISIWYREHFPPFISLFLTSVLSLAFVAFIVFVWFFLSVMKSTSPVTIISPFKTISPKEFTGINVTSALKAPDDCIVVAGARTPHGPFKKNALESDWDAANRLCDKYKLPVIKADIEITQEEKQTKNLIVIGGPMVNELTYEVSQALPICVASITHHGITDKSIFSAPSGEYYLGRNYGVVEVIPSSYNPRKLILLAFGLTREGTEGAIQALIESGKALAENNKFDSQYPAKIVEIRVEQDKVRIQDFRE